MICTNELRWVECTVPALEYGQDVGKIIHVLQQKWVTYWSNDMGGSPREWEWRNVPVEKE